jgi:hypothetical protein
LRRDRKGLGRDQGGKEEYSRKQKSTSCPRLAEFYDRTFPDDHRYHPIHDSNGEAIAPGPTPSPAPAPSPSLLTSLPSSSFGAPLVTSQPPLLGGPPSGLPAPAPGTYSSWLPPPAGPPSSLPYAHPHPHALPPSLSQECPSQEHTLLLLLLLQLLIFPSRYENLG